MTTIKNMGYRELEALGKALAELGSYGRIGKTPLGTELEISYDPKLDTITLDDGERTVELEVSEYNN